ncbi:DUF3380 domain-containing protein [Aeromonas jandaei]|nr:DUF3380 domain-containing protein [Aeromonas jandaei]
MDPNSAIKSCSWGNFQVMGASYHPLYSSPIFIPYIHPPMN